MLCKQLPALFIITLLARTDTISPRFSFLGIDLEFGERALSPNQQIQEYKEWNIHKNFFNFNANITRTRYTLIYRDLGSNTQTYSTSYQVACVGISHPFSVRKTSLIKVSVFVCFFELNSMIKFIFSAWQNLVYPSSSGPKLDYNFEIARNLKSVLSFVVPKYVCSVMYFLNLYFRHYCLYSYLQKSETTLQICNIL